MIKRLPDLSAIKYRSAFFLKYVSDSMLNLTYSVYLKQIGFADAHIGIVWMLYNIVPIALMPLWNFLARNNQLRKLFISGGIALEMCVYIAMLFFTSFPAVLALSVLWAVFRSPTYYMLDNLALQFGVATGREFSSFRLFGSLGAVVACFLAGPIAEAPRLGYDVVIIVSVCLMAVSAVIVMLLPLPARLSEKRAGSYKQLLTNKNLFIALIFFVIALSNVSGSDYYRTIFFLDAGISLSNLSYLLGIMITVEVLTLILLSKLKNPKANKFLALGMIVIFLARNAIFYFCGKTVPVAVSAVFSGLSYGFLVTCIPRMLSALTRPHNISKALNLSVFVNSVSVALFSYFYGVVSEKGGSAAVFLISGALLVVAAIYLLIFVPAKADLPPNS